MPSSEDEDFTSDRSDDGGAEHDDSSSDVSRSTRHSRPPKRERPPWSENVKGVDSTAEVNDAEANDEEPPRKRRATDPARTSGTPSVWAQCPVEEHEIRLLKLHRGSDHVLEATLFVRKKNEEYDALSYTWGDEKMRCEIRIIPEGGGEFKRVRIAPNLELALRTLRYRHKSRFLWIDALCIDQNNAEEKNHQVPNMARIYNDANKVCVWLGKGEDNAQMALTFIKDILDLDKFDRLIMDQESVNLKRWIALWDLMNSSWFSRRWVIQEIALAKEALVFCGDAQPVEWGKFANAVALFGSRFHQISQLFQSSPSHGHHFYQLGDVSALAAYRLVKESSNLFRKSNDGTIQEHLYSLESLVSTLSPFQASNPRDTIYAVLSLAEDTGAIFSARPAAQLPLDPNSGGSQPYSDGEKGKLKSVMAVWRTKVDKPYPVDYNKTFLEVCKDFLDFTIKSSSSLDMICRPWAPVSPKDKLPSWITTLSGAPFRPGVNRMHSRVNADSLVGVPATGQRNYNAARKYPLKGTWRFGEPNTVEGQSLFVSGFQLDTIHRISLPAQQGNIPAKWLKLGGWNDSSSPPPSAFWRTLVGDRGPDGDNPPPYYQVACQQAFLQRPQDDDLNTEKLMYMNKSQRSGTEKVVVEYLRRVQSVTWMRRLITTKLGFNGNNIGLAPESARAKDLICILYGCSVPVVLRQAGEYEQDEKDEKKVYYKLIGECYIHGMMDGEAFRVQNTRSLEKQEFELR